MFPLVGSIGRGGRRLQGTLADGHALVCDPEQGPTCCQASCQLEAGHYFLRRRGSWPGKCKAHGAQNYGTGEEAGA